VELIDALPVYVVDAALLAMGTMMHRAIADMQTDFFLRFIEIALTKTGGIIQNRTVTMEMRKDQYCTL
jgi:hypothetical protein